MKTIFIVLSMIIATSAVAADYQESMSTCYAYTACYDAYGRYSHSISCRVQANASAGVACNWLVVPYRYVECNGMAYDQYGNYGWMSFNGRCW